MKKILFSRHSLERMEQRGITREYVRQALEGTHQTIRTRAAGREMIVAALRGRDLTVVFAQDATKVFVVTAYWGRG